MRSMSVRRRLSGETLFVLTARGNMRHWTPAGPARNWEFDRNRMTDIVTAC